MSSLLGQLLADARKAELGYGIHGNCVITKVTNEERKSKENEKINRNAYTTIAQRDANGEIVSEREISWFNLDPTSEKVYMNWYAQYEQMSAIVSIYQGKKNRWAEGVREILEENGVEADWEEETSEAISVFEKSMGEVLKGKAVCATIVKEMADLYVDILSKKITAEDAPTVRVKFVFDNNGKYVQQPRFGAFVESEEIKPEESLLKITKNDEENQRKSLTSGSVSAPIGKI